MEATCYGMISISCQRKLTVVWTAALIEADSLEAILQWNDTNGMIEETGFAWK